MLRREPLPPLPDRRQSETALAVARGTRRLLAGLGHVSVSELVLACGRRADLVSLADNGCIWIVEVKSSVDDLRSDDKWPDYRLHCDRLFFAIPSHVPSFCVPADTGLIVADSYGADMLREAPEHRLASATRKAMILRFARASAARLYGLIDPEAASGTR